MICQEWVAGAMATLEAEFPAWHLVGCFDVFHLKGSKTTQKRGACTDDALKKLAQVFAVDYKDLSSQYISILPTAAALQRKSGLDNRSAWAQALQHLGGRSDYRRKYPAGALEKAFFFFGCACFYF